MDSVSGGEPGNGSFWRAAQRRPYNFFSKSRSSPIPDRRAADLPALLSDAANERFILRKDCEAVGSFVPEICRQKSTFPGSFPEAVSGKEPRNDSFWRPAQKPVTSRLRTLRGGCSFPRVFGCRPPLHGGAAMNGTFLNGVSHRRFAPPPSWREAFGLRITFCRGGVAPPAQNFTFGRHAAFPFPKMTQGRP